MDDLGFNRRGEPALAAIKFQDAPDIGPGLGPGENLPRGQPDFLADFFFLEALVALQNDPVDHRIFPDLNHQRSRLIADPGVGEQFSGEQRLQRQIEPFAVIGLADPQIDIGAHGFGLQPLAAPHNDLTDNTTSQWRGTGRDLLRQGVARLHHRDPAKHRPDQQSRCQSPCPVPNRPNAIDHAYPPFSNSPRPAPWDPSRAGPPIA